MRSGASRRGAPPRSLSPVLYGPESADGRRTRILMVEVNRGTIGVMSGVVLLLGLTAFILSIVTPWYGAPVFAACLILGALLAVGIHRSRRTRPPISVVEESQDDQEAQSIEPK
jgi:hypothetical protein